MLNLPTARPRAGQASMNTAPSRVAHLMGSQPFSVFLKDPRDSRVVISFNVGCIGTDGLACRLRLMPGRLPPHGSARVPEAPQGPAAKRITAGLGGIQANPPGRRSLACPDPAPSARPVTAPCCGRDRFTVMTTVRIAHTEPWPGRRAGGRGFGFFSMLVVLADDSGGRALPVWLNGPEGHGLFRGRDDDHAYPGSAEEITAGLLRAAGVTVTGVDIDELDPALTTGPRRGRKIAQSTARIEFTAAGTAEPGQMPVRLGYALAMATATGAPVRVADQLMDQLAVPAEGDLAGQFTRDVPLPRRRRGLSRLVGGRKLVRQPAR